jgi:hypothetical protein
VSLAPEALCIVYYTELTQTARQGNAVLADAALEWAHRLWRAGLGTRAHAARVVDGGRSAAHATVPAIEAALDDLVFAPLDPAGSAPTASDGNVPLSQQQPSFDAADTASAAAAAEGSGVTPLFAADAVAPSPDPAPLVYQIEPTSLSDVQKWQSQRLLQIGDRPATPEPEATPDPPYDLDVWIAAVVLVAESALRVVAGASRTAEAFGLSPLTWEAAGHHHAAAGFDGWALAAFEYSIALAGGSGGGGGMPRVQIAIAKILARAGRINDAIAAIEAAVGKLASGSRGHQHAREMLSRLAPDRFGPAAHWDVVGLEESYSEAIVAAPGGVEAPGGCGGAPSDSGSVARERAASIAPSLAGSARGLGGAYSSRSVDRLRDYGLEAPSLPSPGRGPWMAFVDDAGEIYFANSVTLEMTRETPAGFRIWEAVSDRATGEMVYYNVLTDALQYTRPPELGGAQSVWVELRDSETKSSYYYSTITHEVSTTMPADFDGDLRNDAMRAEYAAAVRNMTESIGRMLSERIVRSNEVASARRSARSARESIADALQPPVVGSADASSAAAASESEPIDGSNPEASACAAAAVISIVASAVVARVFCSAMSAVGGRVSASASARGAAAAAAGSRSDRDYDQDVHSLVQTQSISRLSQAATVASSVMPVLDCSDKTDASVTGAVVGDDSTSAIHVVVTESAAASAAPATAAPVPTTAPGSAGRDHGGSTLAAHGDNAM